MDLFDLKKKIFEFCLDETNRAALCFKEALVVIKSESMLDAERVGECCIQIEPIGPQGREFLTHMYILATVDTYIRGMKLISSTTEKLQCLEEKYTELIQEKDGLYEKSQFLGLQQNAYHLKTTYTRPYGVTTMDKSFELHKNGNFISDGAAMLLMRYLAITNYEGTFITRTIDEELKDVEYICIASQHKEMFDEHQKVYTIECITKVLREGKAVTERSRTYLTPNGRILMCTWSDSHYLLVQNPITKQNNTADMHEIPLREEIMNDIEMYSKYIDSMSCNVAKYTNYLTDHPEIKHLIADYVQTLLIVKPVDIIDFTIQHFKAFARKPKVWETDLLMKRSESEINLQLTKDQSNVKCGICGICTKCASQFNK